MKLSEWLADDSNFPDHAPAKTAPAPEPAERWEPIVGAQFHALHDGMHMAAHHSDWGIAPTIFLTRAKTITLTADMISAQVNDAILALVADPETQAKRFGRVMLAPGPAPADMLPIEPGTPQWDYARDVAFAEAWAIQDPERQAIAVHEATRKFGIRSTQTSQNIRYSDGR